MAQSADPDVRRAAQSTLIANRAFRVQRQILAAGCRRALPTGTLRRTIYDAGKLPNLPGKLVRGEGEPTTGDVTVDEAYDGAGQTYTFYNEIFKRLSIDGQGLRLDASVHYCEEPSEGYDNAFWNGEQMVYGDGDGIAFGSFTKSLDVIAHELTHGVTQYEAGLEYHNEAGALNESMSDVFGIMVRDYTEHATVQASDWLIGRELFIKKGMALRSLKHPGTAYDDPDIGKDPQPDSMTGYVKLPDTARGDWGGVHINSGIPNRAFYLACVNLGDSHSWDKAGHIWYDALCNRISSRATFADACAATVAGALLLFGATEAKAVGDAWSQVGVQ